MQILNIAGYKFINLSDLSALKTELQALGAALEIKGTILLSPEGININLAGEITSLQRFVTALQQDARFSDMRFHQTYSPAIPFQRFKVKLKKEIITLKQPSVNAVKARASSISPTHFKQWLEDNKEMVVLDTRNDYEIRFGTFEKAVHLNIDDFSQLPHRLQQLEKEKTIVMFCTGGIRCEKAALYLEDQGFSDVYQLDGGILGYFKEVGGAHYQGDCFVFDERVAINPQLQLSEKTQCRICEGPKNTECATH